MADDIKNNQREDALELALLLYDLFKDDQASAKIENGQNNARRTQDS